MLDWLYKQNSKENSELKVIEFTFSLGQPNMYRQNNQRCRNNDEFKADLILIILRFDFAIKIKGFPRKMPNLALPARITLARRITILLSEPAICLAAYSWLPRQRRSHKGTPESRLRKTSVLQRKTLHFTMKLCFMESC